MDQRSRDALWSFAWTVIFMAVMIGLFCVGELIFYGRVR